MEENIMTKRRKRARNELGQYVGDDKKTPVINEAYQYTWWERVKWGFFMIHPDRNFFKEFKKFVVWVFRGK
jgi:hypothetical protein